MDLNDPVDGDSPHALIDGHLALHVVSHVRQLTGFLLQVLSDHAQILCHLLAVILFTIQAIEFVSILIFNFRHSLIPKSIQFILN